MQKWENNNKKNYPWIGRKKVCPLSYVQTLIFIVVERIITIFLPIHSPLICSPNSSSFWKLMDARNTIKFWIYVLNKTLSLIDHFNELQALSHFLISMNSFFLYCISSFFSLALFNHLFYVQPFYIDILSILLIVHMNNLKHLRMVLRHFIGDF